MTSGKPYPRRHEPPARPHGGTNNPSTWLRTRRGTSTSWTGREQRPVDMVALLGLMLRQNITDWRLVKLMREPPHTREYRLGGTQIPAHQLGGETRARKPSWRRGLHFIRYIKQKMNCYAAGRHRAETLFLHQNGHRKPSVVHRNLSHFSWWRRTTARPDGGNPKGPDKELITGPQNGWEQGGQHLINF